VISGEHPPPIGNLPGYSRITGWQHCRIPHFAAVSPLPFRGSAQCAVLVCNLGCDVETLFGPSLWICAGEFTQTLSWESVPKLNRYVSQCRDVLLDVSHAIPQPMSGWVQQSIAKSG